MKTSKFPEYFAECFFLPICQLHSGKKLELRPGDVCCVVSSVIQSHTTGMEASPQRLPPPALSWESNVVSRASGSWNCLEVNQGTEKLGPRVNYRGNDSGLVSLGMARPVSQHCSPLKSRWKGEVGPFLPPLFPPLCLFLVVLPPHFDAACKDAGAGCLGP